MHGLLQHSHLITGFPHLRLQPSVPSPAVSHYVWIYYSIYCLFLSSEILSLSLLWKTGKTWGPLSPSMYFSLAERKKVSKSLLKVSKSLKVQLNLIFTPFFSPNPQLLPFSPSQTCCMSFPCSLLFPAASFSHHMPWSHPALPGDGSHTMNWGKRSIFPASMRIAVQLQGISTCWCQSGCCCQSLVLSKNQIKRNFSDLASSYVKLNKGMRQQREKMSFFYHIFKALSSGFPLLLH